MHKVFVRECRVLHRNPNALNKVSFCFIFLMMKGKAIYMNCWQDQLSCFTIIPYFRVSILEQTDECIKEFYRINREVHVAVIESEEILWDFSLRSVLTASYDMLNEFSGIHIEGDNKLVYLVHLYVLLQVLVAGRVQVISDDLDLLLDSSLDSQWANSAEHVAQHITFLKDFINHAVPLAAQFGAPVDSAYIYLELDLVFQDY